MAANDKDGLERMCRYLARPPIATDRLSRLDDGRLELRLKRPWRDGTTAFVFTQHELIERLVALVPRPRSHLTRYHGVLAPAFAARAQIVPTDDKAPAPKPRAPRPDTDRPLAGCPGPPYCGECFWRRLGLCPMPGPDDDRRRLTSKAAISRILGHMGLATDAPVFHAPRPPPQGDLLFDDVVLGFEADPPSPDEGGN